MKPSQTPVLRKSRMAQWVLDPPEFRWLTEQDNWKLKVIVFAFQRFRMHVSDILEHHVTSMLTSCHINVNINQHRSPHPTSSTPGLLTSAGLSSARSNGSPTACHDTSKAALKENGNSWKDRKTKKTEKLLLARLLKSEMCYSSDLQCRFWVVIWL